MFKMIKILIELTVKQCLLHKWPENAVVWAHCAWK